MLKMNRKQFLANSTLVGGALVLTPISSLSFSSPSNHQAPAALPDDDLFTYLQRQHGQFNINAYRKLLGHANAYKEGDETLGIAALTEEHRLLARQLLQQTKLKDIDANSVFSDELYQYVQSTPDPIIQQQTEDWTLGELKTFLLTETDDNIHPVLPGLSSDIIACVVKLMSNDELIQVGQKVFNPLTGSNIGSKGYMGARVQPNSPTDHPDDISWQVFCAWSYAVGDLVLGTNPVSSDPKSVAQIEATLFDLLQTFELEDTLPNCVLAHIDIQAEVEEFQPGTTGIWFQSLAGTVGANKTFDVTIEKMKAHAKVRKGKYGLYVESGQGADFTNGHGQGFDMLMHESRKYGFVRALKQELPTLANGEKPWVYVNDVAGFIGPEVFKSKEQLVRTCLEDTVMGKLHGLTIGLDICSTLHMDVTLDDLSWCIDEVMPANPAYLMALPTNNDPMLSYLTTGFYDHVRVREKFGYKVNDSMWEFFKKLGVIDANNKPTDHFGDPIWVYYQYRKAKGDARSKDVIYAEGQQKIAEIEGRGVPIAQGHGKEIWELDTDLDQQMHALYEDAKVSLWTEMQPPFLQSIGILHTLQTLSKNRKDYVYHPSSGEQLDRKTLRLLNTLRHQRQKNLPQIQIIVSDGLNARAIMDEGHLQPYLIAIRQLLTEHGYKVADDVFSMINGRVRAGYQCGEYLFGEEKVQGDKRCVLHIIGERPGSGHHNFSAYITAASAADWGTAGKIDHDITRVVSGISDTALHPDSAAQDSFDIVNQLMS